MNTTAQVGRTKMSEKNFRTEEHWGKYREEAPVAPQELVLESSAIDRDRDDYILTDKSVPVSRLFVLDGSLNGLSVRLLKDNGCSTSLMSKRFVDQNPGLFKKKECQV